MKKIILLLGVIICNIVPVHAQQDTIYFDNRVGNYIVKYIDKIPYAKKSDGTLRKLNFESSLHNDEEYIEIDSLVSLEFIPATKIIPFLQVNVEKDMQNDRLIFNYKVSNDTLSKQNLIRFMLVFSSDSINSRENENTWWNRKIKQLEKARFSEEELWMWAGDNGLEPGWHNSGFILSAQGLPIINNGYFQGKTNTFGWPGSIPQSKVVKELHSLRSFPRNFVTRKTVCPGRIPNPFSPLDFIDTIKTYCDSSYTLGWIESEGILNSLKKKLENAKKNLINGEIEEAIDLLNAFVNEVKAQNEKKLTSEAYALLKFNAEYLIEQIKKE